MTFHPLPGKGKQETQEENNDNYKFCLPYLIWTSLSLYEWGPAEITPILQMGKQRSAPLLQAFLAGGGIYFHLVRCLAGHTLMPAPRQRADP